MHTVVRKLRKAFPLKNNKRPRIKRTDSAKDETASKEAADEEHGEKGSDDDFDAKEALRRNRLRQKKQIELPKINLDECVYITCDHFNFVPFSSPEIYANERMFQLFRDSH